MAHNHSEKVQDARRIQVALFLTATFMVIEVIGGLVSGSLALLADAGHMLTDSLALGLSLIAFRFSERPPDSEQSYGYARMQVLAAFINGLALIGIVVWIFIEAVQRFMSPQDVMGTTMLLIATGGAVINIISFLVLHGGDQENLNVRGAALHVLGDLLGSVGAIAAAVIIILTAWMPIDPILSVLVAALILRSAVKLVRRSAHILLEGVPEGMQVELIRRQLLERIPQVTEIHHVHVWGLTPQQLMLTLHLVLGEETSDTSSIVRQAKTILREEFSISHSTIEVEVECCADA